MTCTVDNFGAQHWRNSQGQFHRTDGPAVIYLDNTRFWYINDQRHRTDCPAVIDAAGTQEWWVNGKRHRTDGPARIHASGGQEWLVKGRDITDEVDSWMVSQEVIWPWDSSTQTLFTLTFGM